MVEKRLHNEQGKPITLFGYPVIVSEDMPTLKQGDVMLTRKVQPTESTEADDDRQ